MHHLQQNEARDGNELTGTYSFVDPRGEKCYETSKYLYVDTTTRRKISYCNVPYKWLPNFNFHDYYVRCTDHSQL